MLKENVVIIEEYTLISYIQNIIQYSVVKANYTCKNNYWGSSVWISMKQITYTAYIVHSSNASEKSRNTMGQYVSYLWASKKAMIQVGEKFYIISSLSLVSS
jgi:hypothetical protein